MRSTPKSTIAQLLFVHPPLPDFSAIVSELDKALDRCPAERRSVTWDCEDVAFFELDDMRVALSISDAPDNGFLSCLAISVGPNMIGAQESALTRRHEGLCRMIADGVQQRYPVEAILWHQAESPVTSDTLDNLLDRLPDCSDLDRLKGESDNAAASEAPVAPQPAVTAARARIAATTARAAEPAPDRAPGADAAVANDIPDLPRLFVEDLRRVREALYPEEAEGYVAPPDKGALARRLAAHTMNTTLIMVSLPVGGALLTYSVLRGEDMRLTSRAMALTGLALGLMQTSFGQQIAAMITI
ncbi:MAG: hypothetical protein Q8O82_02575 [Pseudorhodobacter sp.]|nr:hypothetical protein [Pseudorhodobacter sp.]